MLFGKIDNSLTVDHLCRNRRCVNPHHLELVSITENQRRGSSTKLTHADVKEIRSTKPRHGDRADLAKKYGVSQMTISDIRHNRSWKDI